MLYEREGSFAGVGSSARSGEAMARSSLNENSECSLESMFPLLPLKHSPDTNLVERASISMNLIKQCFHYLCLWQLKNLIFLHTSWELIMQV